MGNTDWTITTLKELLETRIGAVEEQTKLALTSADKAVSKAEAATEKRFDSVNEFRNAMKDQQATFAPREETDRRFAALEKAADTSTGKSQGVGMVLVVIVSSISLLSTVIGIILVLVKK